MRSIAPQPYREFMAPSESDATLVGSWCCPRAQSALQDYSVAGNDMTAYGSTKFGLKNSFVGDGSTAYLRAAVANYRSADAAGTIEAWIFQKANTIASYFSSCDEGVNTRRFEFGYAVGGYLTLLAYNDATQNLVSAPGATISLAQWTHVIGVSNGSSYLLYTNGVPRTITVGVGANDGKWFSTVTARDNAVVGARVLLAGAAQWANAEIAAVNVFSEAKTADWVAKRFKSCVPDSSLVLWVPGDGRDYSRYARSVTITSQPKTGEYITTDGTDDKLDYGDLGNIRTISFWARPSTTTQELLLIDTGKDIMVSSGTITYTGLTPTATYVNGTASTTLAASVWQHVVCVLNADVDANNFEIGNDGANYGAFDMRDLRVFNEVKSADWAALAYRTARGGV